MESASGQAIVWAKEMCEGMAVSELRPEAGGQPLGEQRPEKYVPDARRRRWVAISCSTPSIVQRVLTLVGGEELANDPRFQTAQDRVKHVDELDAIMQAWMGERDLEQVMREFETAEGASAKRGPDDEKVRGFSIAAGGSVSRGGDSSG